MNKTKPFILEILLHIEDLKRVVISYEMYETSLWRVSYISYEMSMSVRFCLSYDHFKMNFISYKVGNCSTENAWLTWNVVVTLLVPAKVLCNVWSYNFYDMTLRY